MLFTDIMEKIVIISGASLGIIAIVLGAFGAHAFKKILPEDKMASFEVGVRYQMYAALYLLIIGGLLDFDSVWENWAYYGVFYGAILFSGSIYLLSFKEYWKAERLRFLGPITPLGGLFMIIGWLALLISFLQS